MFDSVRARLTLWHAAILAAALIVFALLVYSAAARNFYARQDESLRSTAETVASAYIQELEEEGSVVKANEVVLAQMVFPNRFVEVTDAEGRAIAQSSNLTNHPLVIPAATLAESRAHRVGFTSYSGLRVAVVPLSPDRNKELGFAIVAESLNVITDSLSSLRRNFYAGVPLILVLASLGGYFLARKSLAPMALMNEQTRTITAGNLSSRLDVANPRDEVGRLATTINALLERLDVAFQEQQRFIADSSHELRTPVTVIRTEAEVALERQRDPKEYQASLALVRDEAERLSRIVEDLFMLARQPVASRGLMKETIHLDVLVRDCARAAQVLAARKGVRFDSQSNIPEVSLSGDDDLLKRLLLNLLDNAVKYTPRGGEIKLRLATHNGDARITVEDTGVGIAAEDQPRVFDRFYRVDRARSRALGGAGLGLSIARWIVEAHKGKISVESKVGTGSTFTVELPLRG
ncbi:MAG TPA: heavy metal sensor histidine kinase [Pyrinomonadaceae bacterium]